jgi:hypothetical protein
VNTQHSIFTLALIASVGIAPSTQAQTLDLTLLDANQTVTQGTTAIDFDATISNSSSTLTIYLNGATANTSSSLLTVDVSPFFANAPFSLAPGQSSGPFEIFAVDLAANTPTGNYVSNDFELLGGADGGNFASFNDLADPKFSVTVTSSTVAAPEIDPASAVSTLVMFLGGLAVLRGRRVCVPTHADYNNYRTLG